MKLFSLPLHIAFTYLMAKNKRGFVSFIAKISTLGLIISIMSLITVLSVMNGFQDELKNRILGAISHAYLTNHDESLPDDTPLLQALIKHKSVIGVSPYIEKYALLNYQSNASGVLIRGIDPTLELQTSKLLSNVRYGSHTLNNNNQIIVGYGLAGTLGVGIGDKITLFTPDIQQTITGILPRFKRFIVSGIFDAGSQEYNDSLALIHLKSAQRLYQMPNLITGLRLKFDNVLQADTISKSLSKQLDSKTYIVHWMSQKQNLIRALSLEKTMIGVILFFIIAIAAFNLVSMMIMVVMEKKDDIAILATMGLAPKGIMQIFFYQGLLISLLGIIIGVVLGVILSLNIGLVVGWIEAIFDFSVFPADVFYVSKLPSTLIFSDVLFTIMLALTLSVLAALYPAKKAAQSNISQILRHE